MDGTKISRIHSIILRLACFSLAAVLCLSSCSSDQTKRIKTEQIEMFNMQEVNGEFQQGAMTFAESFVYDEQGNKVDHRIRQSDNALNREKYIYKDGQLTRSNYYSPDSTLLSFYIYEYENGLLKSKFAHEATTQDLLRIDEYEYNPDGTISKHYIKSALGKISRTMAFGYDAHGNEIQVSIRDDSGRLLVNEEFKITAYDVDKRWLERWSFNNDKPLTKRTRTLTYY